jgi:four helix bundle protein
MQDSPLLIQSRAFALSVATLINSIPDTIQGRVIAQQLMKSATSTAANYRATRRARSKAEFVAKLGVVLEEIDESEFWLGILSDLNLCKRSDLLMLQKEATEIAAMAFAARRTAMRRFESDSRPSASSTPSPSNKR